MDPADAPTLPTGADAKWRFFWRVGERPPHTQFAELNAAPVIPAAFPEWPAVLDTWGARLLGTVWAVAEMAARGLGLDPGTFTSRMAQGPHLLAPTGTDLEKRGALGTVYAGFHYDLNFLTIHGRSRVPGLFVWLRSGRRIPVHIPEGCLLLQAGKQLEWLTGGHIRAGFHEVRRGSLGGSLCTASDRHAGRCCLPCQPLHSRVPGRSANHVLSPWASALHPLSFASVHDAMSAQPQRHAAWGRCPDA